MNPRSAFSRPLVRLALVAFAALFVMAPTPGDVGGCSDSNGAAHVMAMPGFTLEQTFFDQSLCAAFCWRLRECGVLCSALNPMPPHCDNNSQDVYTTCVRGQIRADFFGVSTCPHSCPPHTRLVQPTQFDEQACIDAVLQRNCNATGDNSIGFTFRDAPGECTNLCQ